jgi:hypothetical protein
MGLFSFEVRPLSFEVRPLSFEVRPRPSVGAGRRPSEASAEGRVRSGNPDLDLDL